jgi:transcriptional regulator with XRE-family HTH domain
MFVNTFFQMYNEIIEKSFKSTRKGKTAMKTSPVQRIVEARKKQGISQKKVAQLLQTTQQQVSLYETEKQELPLRRFIELGKFLDVSLDYLGGISDYPKPPRGNYDKSQVTKEKNERIINEEEVLSYSERTPQNHSKFVAVGNVVGGGTLNVRQGV